MKYEQIDNIIENLSRVHKSIDKEGFEHTMRYINISNIENFKFPDEEYDLIFTYLKEKNIFVTGSTAYYNDYDNYIQKSLLPFYKSPTKLLEEVHDKYVQEYDKTRNVDLRNKLIESNMYLVYYLCKNYSSVYGIDKDILISYGAEGLIIAVDKYDSNKGKFSALIATYIRGYIRRGILKETFGHRGASSLLKRINSNRENGNSLEYLTEKNVIEKENYKKLHDDNDLIEELFKRLYEKKYVKGKDLEELKELSYCKNPISLEQAEENILDNNYNELDLKEKELFDQQLSTYISELLSEGLSEREKTVLKKYYGLSGTTASTCQQIGEEYGVSTQNIQQIKARSLKKLGKKLKNNNYYNILKAFIENTCDYSNEKNSYTYVKK